MKINIRLFNVLPGTLELQVHGQMQVPGSVGILIKRYDDHPSFFTNVVYQITSHAILKSF